MNRCSFNIHLGQPSVFISTWFCCHLSQQTKNTTPYVKNSTYNLTHGDHNFHLLVNNNKVETTVSSTLHEKGRMTG